MCRSISSTTAASWRASGEKARQMGGSSLGKAQRRSSAPLAISQIRILFLSLPSTPPEASSLPSWLKARKRQPRWACQVAVSLAVGTAQKRITLASPIARVLLSGEKARAAERFSRQGLTPESFSTRLSCFPVLASHRRTVPSSPPREARYLPSGEKTTAAIMPRSCPSRRRRSFPESTSQSRTASSQPPEASVLPSGEKAMQVTLPLPTESTRTSSGFLGLRAGRKVRAWCPANRRTSLPVPASNRRRWLSPPPTARYLPSGEYATAVAS